MSLSFNETPVCLSKERTVCLFSKLHDYIKNLPLENRMWTNYAGENE